MPPSSRLPPHLQQTVANQRHQQVVSVPLTHHRCVLRRVHAGEVKHGHVRLPIVVGGVVQGGELVVGAKVSGLAGVAQQRFLVDVVAAQQTLGVDIVLCSNRKRARGVKVWESVQRECGPG